MSAPIVRSLGPKHERLKRLRRLVRQAKVRLAEGAFVVDGPTLVAEALTSDLVVEEIFLGRGQPPPWPLSTADDPSMVREHRPPPAAADSAAPPPQLFEAEPEVLISILDPAHPRPVAAVVGLPQWSLADVNSDDRRERPVLVAVEIADPGNFGTLVRTAEASGCAGVVAVGSTVDPYGPKAVRASAGSILRTPVVRLAEADQAFELLGSSGRQVVAAVVDPGAPSYDQVDLRSAAIVVGSEARGLDRSLLSSADQLVTIPMHRPVESLNVAAATAVLAFEAARQRRGGRTVGPSGSGQGGGDSPPVTIGLPG